MSFTEAFNAATEEVAATTATEPEATEAPAAAEGTEEVTEPVVSETATEDATAEPTEPATEPVLHRVKVDGEEVEVTLEELLAGYSRTAHFTKQSQALAAEKQRLADAEALFTGLEADPETTLRALMQHYGVGDTEGEALDPVEARLQAVERAEAARQEQARMDAIDAAIAQLQQQYGEFDPTDLMKYAVERKIPDLHDAYKAMTFDAIREQAAADAEAARQKAEADALAAKRQATVVEGGSSGSNADSVKPEAPAKPTIRQALAMAGLKV